MGACARDGDGSAVNRVGTDGRSCVRKVTEGPNSFDEGNVIIKPKKGDTIHLGASSRSATTSASRGSSASTAATSTFGRACWWPGMVSHDMDDRLRHPAAREPQLDPGESIERRLVFPYPEGQSPTRLSCAPMVIPLPQF
jgi:hypothetical protein